MRVLLALLVACGGIDVATTASAEPVVLIASNRTGQIAFSGAAANEPEASAVVRATEKRWLIFIHGFNSSAADVTERATDIARSLDANLLLLDWPAGRATAIPANFGGYVSDRIKAANSSGSDFAPLLARLFTGRDDHSSSRVDLVAHSMGAEVTRSSLMAQHIPAGLFSQIVLIAPFTFASQFDADAARVLEKAKGLTVYASTLDLVLGGGRVLSAENYQVLGSLYRPSSATASYDLVNTSCVYSRADRRDPLGHYPRDQRFRADVLAVLSGTNVTPLRTKTRFRYTTRIKRLQYDHPVLTLGDPAHCSKMPRGSLTVE